MQKMKGFALLLMINLQEPIYGSEVNQLANNCYAIKSGESNRFLSQIETGGLINDGESFAFEDGALETADAFYFKPTEFGKYLISNQNGRYLSSRLPHHITAEKQPRDQGIWQLKLDKKDEFKLKSTFINQDLKRSRNNSSVYLFRIWNPLALNSEKQFKLIPKTGCLLPEEISLNAEGELSRLKTDRDQIRGFVDPHTLITSNVFLGGRFIHGAPFAS